MPHAFVHLHPDLEAAIDGALVLTTTERLRRNLIRAYNDAKLRAGKTAWSTPRVQTLGNYLNILYRARRSEDPDLPLLLSAEAEYANFRATAPAGAAELVPLAQDAWNLCHQWGIPIESGSLGATENGLVFAEWCERLQRRLSSRHAITRAQLTSVSKLETTEQRVCCVAFEQVPTELLNWLEAQNTELDFLSAIAPPQRSSTAYRTSFDTADDELAAVSGWTREILMDDVEATARIGIIVPDLGSRYHSVLRQFTAELDPLLATGTQGLIDIGGGIPLREQPVWQPARDWLALCFDQLSAERTRACLNSPYLQLPPLVGLPANLPPALSLLQLDRQLDLAGLDPALINEVRLTRGSELTLAGWIDAFQSVLNQAGWTGQNAGSNQFQAWQDISQRLPALRQWAEERSISGRDALAQLDQFFAGVTFAPERPPAPVQIMGYLESTGLDFTHLWVVGLDDESWPRVPNPNPFVPIRIQKQYGLPRITPEQEAAFAGERLHHWSQSADELIVSHVRHREESEVRPSPLIRHLPALERLQEHRPHPCLIHQPDQIETLEDDHGLALGAGQHRGGTGRIRDQATCPFRGYAIHRLGLKEVRQPRGLPDALDRGILVHEALHRLYEHATEAGRAAETLTDVEFGQAADQALAKHYGRFPAPYRTRERERLVLLLDAWNRLETARTDVAIESLELGLTAEFNEIGLNLRIDRVDRIGDAHLVIDYKTGTIGNRLTQDRLLDPQLPLYALTNESVQGVLYAEIDETRPRLKGISELEVAQAKVDPPAGGSWAGQRERWQNQIDTLTEEIKAGFASVTPYDDRACQLCHLRGLCRVAATDQAPE